MAAVVVSRKYEPGDLIYTEEAFAKVLPRKKKDDKCETCGKSSEDLLPCSECLEVKYCKPECKEKDSVDHRLECPNMHKLPEDHDDEIRLLGRIILKIKGKNWKTITRNVMGTEVSFDDINSHYEEMTTNPRLVLLYKTLKEPLKNFIGEENMPKEVDLIKIIGKLRFNSGMFSSCFPDVFYFGMEKFEHQCIPNSNLETEDNVMKVWAIKKIGRSEKVTVSHTSILTTVSMRSPMNDENLEVCKCTECSLPYGTSVLTKIKDETKAYDVIRHSEKLLRMCQVLSNLDLEEDFRLRILVDNILERHEGVLAPTNALHLKFLAIKALTLGGTDIQKKMNLLELERHMSAVFGEYYCELEKIYKGLVVMNFKLNNFPETAYYLKKLKKTQIYHPEENDTNSD